MAEHRIVLNGGRPLLPVQDTLLRSRAIVCGVFGGWRSGKTRGCAIKLLANAIANPWREEYGRDHPFSIVIGLTWKVLVDSAHREIMAIVPPGLIAREQRGASWELTLINGHVIKFRTARGAVEGASACGVWLDEAHLLPDEKAFLNYQMRASDALGRRFVVLVSGLPESGWLQDTFDRPEHASDASRLTLFAATAANRYNPPHVIDQFRASVSRKTAIKYLEGQWMPRENAIYYEWDPRLHLVDQPGDRKKPVHLGVDIGDKGAVLFFQEVERTVKVRRKDGVVTEKQLGLHVVDEILPEGRSTRGAMEDARARGWIIDGDRSSIYIDPTSRSDEIAAIRDVFGDRISIVRKKRGDDSEAVEYGHDAVNAALRDVDGNVRLTVYSGLPREQRSLLSVITRYHRNATGRPHRDNTVDHVLDAFRYPVASLLPLRSTA